MPIFSDPLHEEFGCWALGFVPYGGSDVGEVMAVADEVGTGDDDAFFEAWSSLADRRVAEAEDALGKGHTSSAREGFLRAGCFYAIAYHPLYGTPVDPRLVDTFGKQMKAFDRAMQLCDPPVEKVDVPYEGTHLPAYLIRAVGHEDEVRPLLLAGTGWDATVTETYFGFGLAAAERGYHVLMHDGPGQGRLLIEEGLPLRHDWEHVITAVVDAAEKIDIVDQSKIVLESWSLGGYFAPRAASFEHRLAGCIADPGEYDIFAGMHQLAHALGLSAEKAARLPEIDPDDATKLTAAIAANKGLNWKVVKRGFWTNATPDLASWFAELSKWTVADCVGQITCPTLVTAAENDAAASGAQQLYDALQCPKKLVHFKASDGAGIHCEMLNRSLLNRTVFDWLDETV